MRSNAHSANNGAETPVLRIARTTGLPLATVNRVIQAYAADIVRSLSEGTPVALRGIGSFSFTLKKGRMARNFKTNECYRLPDVYAVTFKPGKTLRALARETQEAAP